jgi:hypothetical protein
MIVLIKLKFGFLIAKNNCDFLKFSFSFPNRAIFMVFALQGLGRIIILINFKIKLIFNLVDIWT